MAKVTGNVIKFPEHSHNGSSSDDGGNDMNKYVTHDELKNTELRLTNQIENIDHKIDLMIAHIDTKFESVNVKFAQQKVWLITTVISVAAATCTIVGLMIKLIH